MTELQLLPRRSTSVKKLLCWWKHDGHAGRNDSTIHLYNAWQNMNQYEEMGGNQT